LIERGLASAERGVALNADVSQSFSRINQQVNRVAEMMAEIATAADQQASGVSQINTALDQLNAVTQQVAANAEESASAAEELNSQAASLNDTVAAFQLAAVDTRRAASTSATRHSAKPRLRISSSGTTAPSTHSQARRNVRHETADDRNVFVGF
jgi:methyl-accepting chemotaxis protein